MSGRFLRIAFEILDSENRPLTAAQIVDIAAMRSILRTKGKTPANTMRARLSDDIRAQADKSLFQRIGPNRFGLREWDFAEYHARPFQKSIPDEITVCVPGTIQEILGAGGVGYSPISDGLLLFLKRRQNLFFIDRQTAETTSKYKQLIAYVWLETEDGLVLTYTRGKYSSAHRTLLLGRRSVGFGGHVLQQDTESLFSEIDGGLEQAAMREIAEELGGILPEAITPIGVIWDDSSFEGQKHIGVVMRGRLPHSTRIPNRSGELSINELRLLSKKELWNTFHAMEFWSQLLIKEMANEYRPLNISSIVPSRRPKRMGHIAFVGEIANGKTWLSSALTQAIGYRVVSASAVLRRILGVGDMPEEGRLKFQTIALRFIKSESGPDKLAEGIVSEINQLSGDVVIIDGIRQLTTLAALRKLIPDLIVIYIDCPRDLAYRNYCTRLPGASAIQFAAVREHQVEADLPLFRFESDAILNNADELEKSLTLLVKWLTGKPV